jgi:hypothetical protein
MTTEEQIQQSSGMMSVERAIETIDNARNRDEDIKFTTIVQQDAYRAGRESGLKEAAAICHMAHGQSVNQLLWAERQINSALGDKAKERTKDNL